MYAHVYTHACTHAYTHVHTHVYTYVYKTVQLTVRVDDHVDLIVTARQDIPAVVSKFCFSACSVHDDPVVRMQQNNATCTDLVDACSGAVLECHDDWFKRKCPATCRTCEAAATTSDGRVKMFCEAPHLDLFNDYSSGGLGISSKVYGVANWKREWNLAQYAPVHNYMGHNYIGHTCIGHNYAAQVWLCSSLEYISLAVAPLQYLKATKSMTIINTIRDRRRIDACSTNRENTSDDVRICRDALLQATLETHDRAYAAIRAKIRHISYGILVMA